MRRIKELRKNYIIGKKRGEMCLLPRNGRAEEKERVISEVKNNFDDKLLNVASEVEEMQKERLMEVQEFNTEIRTRLQKLNDERMMKDVVNYTVELTSLEEAASARMEEMNKRRRDVYEEINKKMEESLCDECGFLNKGAAIHTAHGEIGCAMELKEIVRGLLRSASDVIAGIVNQYEESIYCICRELGEALDSKNEALEVYLNELEVLEESRKEADLSAEELNKDGVNAPKTHNELKKFLKSKGFEIERHNGSHQIYRNAESGEVRVLPSRRGAHVLAPKTRKKIIEGVAI